MATPTFDAFVLAAVCDELRRTIVGARVQRIHQPEPAEVVLSLFGPHGAFRLLLCADPTAPRLHLTQQRRDNPKQPPGFCQVARKDLEGAWLESIEMPALDRVATLGFRTADGESATLVAELMGRNANVFLLDSHRRIRGALRPETGIRNLKHGALYSPPPGLGEGNGGTFARAELEIRGVTAEELLTQPFAPHSVAGEDGHTVGVWAFEPLTVPGGLRFPRESVSVALDTFYALRASAAGETDERKTLERALRREAEYRKKALEGVRKTLREAERADAHEETGNLLLGQLSAIEKGQAEVTLDDWFLGGTRAVALDPKKTPHENAEAYFARARKSRDAGEWADGRAADLEDELVELARLESALGSAEPESLSDLHDALAELVGADRVDGKPAAPPGTKPFDGHRVRKLDLDGWTLLIGENAEANDYLLKRVATPSDFWMHVRGASGAHGVLRTLGKPKLVPEAVIRRAAGVVAARSGNEKHATLVPVDLVERRYVRKPKGAGPGKVTFSHGRTLDVNPALK